MGRAGCPTGARGLCLRTGFACRSNVSAWRLAARRVAWLQVLGAADMRVALRSVPTVTRDPHDAADAATATAEGASGGAMPPARSAPQAAATHAGIGALEALPDLPAAGLALPPPAAGDELASAGGAPAAAAPLTATGTAPASTAGQATSGSSDTQGAPAAAATRVGDDALAPAPALSQCSEATSSGSGSVAGEQADDGAGACSPATPPVPSSSVVPAGPDEELQYIMMPGIACRLPSGPTGRLLYQAWSRPSSSSSGSGSAPRDALNAGPADPRVADDVTLHAAGILSALDDPSQHALLAHEGGSCGGGNRSDGVAVAGVAGAGTASDGGVLPAVGSTVVMTYRQAGCRAQAPC